MITGLYQLWQSLNLDISFEEWKRKYFQKAKLRVKKHINKVQSFSNEKQIKPKRKGLQKWLK